MPSVINLAYLRKRAGKAGNTKKKKKKKKGSKFNMLKAGLIQNIWS
jgi:hypothetical protein